MRNYLSSLFVLLMISCGSKEAQIIVRGNLKNSSLKKVYLTDSYNWTVFLDSADVLNGSFSFSRPATDLNKIFSIYYKDSTGKVKSIEYINRVLSPNKVAYLTNYFIIDSNTIEIYGDWNTNKDNYYDIKSGIEQKALFRTQMMEFGYLQNTDSIRTKMLSEYIAIIREYPNSTYLLSKIIENKSVLKYAELQLILDNFSKQAIESKNGQALQRYLATKKVNKRFQNILLESPNKENQPLYDTTSSLNMLVIWASWCGPCRQEIPMLKQLFQSYSYKGLRITSISIDEQTEKWIYALKQEHMDWRQLIVPANKMESFKGEFEIGSIPCTIFIDKTGKELYRTIGIDKNSLPEYRAIIEKNL